MQCNGFNLTSSYCYFWLYRWEIRTIVGRKFAVETTSFIISISALYFNEYKRSGVGTLRTGLPLSLAYSAICFALSFEE